MSPITTPHQLTELIGEALEQAQKLVLDRKALTSKELPHIPLYYHCERLVVTLGTPPKDAIHVATLTHLQAKEGLGSSDMHRITGKIRSQLTKIGACSLPGEVLDIKKQSELFDVGPKRKVVRAWE